jgi:hypothetical protein
MAKRFIDTGFFKSPFVRFLKAPLKSLYLYIICDCDGAGIWVKDLEIASAYVGEKITEKDFDVFVKSNKAIDLNNGKYFFPDFIEHQYPQGLSEKNPAQKNFINELKKYDLIDSEMNIKKGASKHLESPSKRDLGNGNGIGNGKGIGNGEENTKPKIELIYPFDSENFIQVWNTLRAQPKWKGKTKDALQASLKILSNLNEQQAIETMMASIAGGWQGLFPEKAAKLSKGKVDQMNEVYIKAAQNLGLKPEHFEDNPFHN